MERLNRFIEHLKYTLHLRGDDMWKDLQTESNKNTVTLKSGQFELVLNDSLNILKVRINGDITPEDLTKYCEYKDWLDMLAYNFLDGPFWDEILAMAPLALSIKSALEKGTKIDTVCGYKVELDYDRIIVRSKEERYFPFQDYLAIDWSDEEYGKKRVLCLDHLADEIAEYCESNPDYQELDF